MDPAFTWFIGFHCRLGRQGRIVHADERDLVPPAVRRASTMTSISESLGKKPSLMDVVPRNQRLATSIFALLLVSCSATRHMAVAPEGADDLSRFVLIVEEMPGGQVAHSWQTL